VVSLWRYPVKAMMGEELNAADVTQRGLFGDRAYALVDSSNEKVASAKNPRKWAKLFDFRAALAEPNDWVGKTLVIGLGILRTAAQHNQVNVGVYGGVLQGGTTRRGDPVRVESCQTAPYY
jgi:uncharacterized protein YcbX